jgi:hypothetical protein
LDVATRGSALGIGCISPRARIGKLSIEDAGAARRAMESARCDQASEVTVTVNSLGQAAIRCREVDIVVGQTSLLNHGARIDNQSSVADVRITSGQALTIHDQGAGSGGNNGRPIDVHVRVVREKLITALNVGIGDQSSSDRRIEDTKPAGDKSAGIKAVFGASDRDGRGSARSRSVGQVQVLQSDTLGRACSDI